MFPAGWSLVWGVCSGGGGVGIPACTADGMHTTGMHSCSINLQDNFTSRQRSCGKVNFQSCLFVIHSIERGGRSFHIWGSSPSSEPWTCSNLLNLEYSVHGSQDMSRHCQVEPQCAVTPKHVQTCSIWTLLYRDCPGLNLELPV